MPDTYAEIKAEIEAKIARAQQDIVCSVMDGSEIEVMCTRGTRYIAICDCINSPPPPDFAEFATANGVAVWCMDTPDSHKIIEYLGLDADPDICPLLYDVITEEGTIIGQTYSSIKWGISNGANR